LEQDSDNADNRRANRFWHFEFLTSIKFWEEKLKIALIKKNNLLFDLN